jgi:Chaperone of endosialidase
MATQKRFVASKGLDNNNNTITNVVDPVNAQDAATKNYTDTKIAAYAATTVTLTTYKYTATAAQTTFSGADDAGLTLTYAGAIMVSLNGVKLRPVTDYTSSSGNSIVLTLPASVGDDLVIETFAAFNVATPVYNGTVTLNSGTTNGVAYLNGSKVLTTGSALTFDGTNLAVGSASAVGGGRIGAIMDLSLGNGLVLRDSATTYASNDNYVLLQNSAGSTAGGLTHPAAASLGVWGVTDIQFFLTNSATEQMRLNSTGLGIGTSSPAYKLDVNGTSAFRNTVNLDRSSTSANAILNFTTALAYDWQIYTDSTATPALVFGINGGAERMRLNNAGNLGLGVTPSAWSLASTSALQVKQASLFGYLNNSYIQSNAYFNSGWKYIASDYAQQYIQASGQHQWYNAASGTAGNAITFTQAMTLDANGALTVGNTSPFFASTNRGNVSINGSAGAVLGLAKGGTGYGYMYTDGTIIEFGAALSGIPLKFMNGTEVGRFDASGNLLRGQTSSGNANSRGFYSDAAGYFGQNHLNGDASGSVYAYFGYNGSTIGTITQAGTTGVLYNITSDYRLKNIAGPVTNSGAFIDKLNPVQGSWKADGSRFIGFLAHELQEASETTVGTGVKDGKEMQSIDYSNAELIANLVAEIQSLRKRLATLEAK